MSYGAGISSFKSVIQSGVKQEKNGGSKVGQVDVPKQVPKRIYKSKLEYTKEYCDSIEAEYKLLSSKRLEEYKIELEKKLNSPPSFPY